MEILMKIIGRVMWKLLGLEVEELVVQLLVRLNLVHLLPVMRSELSDRSKVSKMTICEEKN
jgi:hypothetical protein